MTPKHSTRLSQEHDVPEDDTQHTAARDYPELGSILDDRPDPGRQITVIGSKTAAAYGTDDDARNTDYNGGEGDAGMYWAEPGQQDWMHEHAGPQEEAPPPPWASPVMARLAELEEAAGFFGRYATTVNGTQVDDAGDAPEHGTAVRAQNPDSYDDASHEGEGDDKWNQAVPWGDKKAENAATVGMYPEGISGGGGPSVGVGAFTADAREWEQRPDLTHMHGEMMTPQETAAHLREHHGIDFHPGQASPAQMRGVHTVHHLQGFDHFSGDEPDLQWDPDWNTEPDDPDWTHSSEDDLIPGSFRYQPHEDGGHDPVFGSQHTARVPWTGEERGRLHRWQQGQSASWGDFVNSAEFLDSPAERSNVRHEEDGEGIGMLEASADEWIGEGDEPDSTPAPGAGGGSHQGGHPWHTRDFAAGEWSSHAGEGEHAGGHGGDFSHTLSSLYAEATSDRQWEMHLRKDHGWGDANFSNVQRRGDRLSDMHEALHSAGLANHQHVGGPEQARQEAHEQQLRNMFGRDITENGPRMLTPEGYPLARSENGGSSSEEPMLGIIRSKEARPPVHPDHWEQADPARFRRMMSSLQEAALNVHVRIDGQELKHDHDDEDNSLDHDKDEDNTPDNPVDKTGPDNASPQLDDPDSLDNPADIPGPGKPGGKSSGPADAKGFPPGDPMNDPGNWPAAGAEVNERERAYTQGSGDGKKQRGAPAPDSFSPDDGDSGGGGDQGDDANDGDQPDDDSTPFSKDAALGMFLAASESRAFRFEFTATWHDVVAKAKRIRAEGHVRITHASVGMVIGEVRGDHDTYESGIQRPVGKRQTIQHWACGCPWASFHQDKSYGGRYAGRPCSHVMALQFEAQAKGMFGRTVEAEPAPARWAPDSVVVKSWPPYDGAPHRGQWREQWRAPLAHLDPRHAHQDDPYVAPIAPADLAQHIIHHHGLSADNMAQTMNVLGDDERINDWARRWHDSEHQYRTTHHMPHQHDLGVGTPGEEHWPDVFEPELGFRTDPYGGTPVRRVPSETEPFRTMPAHWSSLAAPSERATGVLARAGTDPDEVGALRLLAGLRAIADFDGYRREDRPSRVVERSMEDHLRRQRTGTGWETEMIPNRNFVSSPASVNGGVTHLMRGYMNGQPTGVISAGASNNMAAWKIHNVHVHPEFRGTGAAEALMDSFYDHVKNNGGRWIDHGIKTAGEHGMWQDYAEPHPEMNIHNSHPEAGWGRYFPSPRVHRDMLVNARNFPGTSPEPGWESTEQTRYDTRNRWTRARGINVEPDRGEWPERPVNDFHDEPRTGETAPQRGPWAPGGLNHSEDPITWHRDPARRVTADQANAPWGSDNVSERPTQKPYGATSPPDTSQDPGSYGFLSAPDPANWGGIDQDSAMQMPMTNTAAQHWEAYPEEGYRHPLFDETRHEDTGDRDAGEYDWSDSPHAQLAWPADHAEGRRSWVNHTLSSHQLLVPGAPKPVPGDTSWPGTAGWQAEDQGTFGFTDQSGTAGPSTAMSPRDPNGIRMEESRYFTRWHVPAYGVDHHANAVSQAASESADRGRDHLVVPFHQGLEHDPKIAVTNDYSFGNNRGHFRVTPEGQWHRYNPDQGYVPWGRTPSHEDVATQGYINHVRDFTPAASPDHGWEYNPTEDEAYGRGTYRAHEGPIDPVFGALNDTIPQLDGALAELRDHPEPALPSTTGDDEIEATAAADGTIGGGSAGTGEGQGAAEDTAALGEFGAARRMYLHHLAGTPMGDLARQTWPQAQQPSPVTQEPGMGSGDDMLSPDDQSIQTIGNQQWSGGGADSDEVTVPAGQPQGGMDDIVAAFQRSAAARAYTGGGAAPGHADGDIAVAARQYLSKTADVLPKAEADELIGEGRGQRARNLNLLRLEGTHYEDEDEELSRRGISLDDHDDDVVCA